MTADERRQLWTQRIAVQEASGLKVAAWCRQEGLDESTFYHQRKRLQASKPPGLIEVPMHAGSQEMRKGDDPAKACEVQHSARTRGAAKKARSVAIAATSPDVPLEIQTPDGFVIRLAARVQLDWLPHLLAVL